MTLPRQTFPARTADLGFSMEMPVGFHNPPLPDEKPDFSNPVATVPLLVTASPIALALITVSARPAYEDGSLVEWFTYLTNHHEMSVSNLREIMIGGLTKNHPGLGAEGSQMQDGIELAMRFAVFEDGARLVIGHAICPREIENSYMVTLGQCIRSIELTDPKGPTVPILPGRPVPELGIIPHDPALPPPRDAGEVWQRMMHTKRSAAVANAAPLMAEDRFDEAERIVRAADDSISGSVALGKLFTEALRAEVAKGGAMSKSRAEELFRRALRIRLNCYPDPHTQMEADSFREGQQQDRADLISILGYEPG